MSRYLALTAVLLGLAAASPCWAQRTLNFGGADPTKIVNKPISVPDFVAAPQRVQKPSLGLANFFHKVNVPSSKPIQGISRFPTSKNMPGADYLKPFRWRYGQPVK
jgi:hypothetical protein